MPASGAARTTSPTTGTTDPIQLHATAHNALGTALHHLCQPHVDAARARRKVMQALAALRGLDVAGRPTLLQGARQGGPFVIEGSAAAQASNDKRQALLRGSIGPRIAPQGPQTPSKTFQKPSAGACPTCAVQSAGALQSTE